MAKKADKADKRSKPKASGGSGDGAVLLSVASHPRARTHVRSAKGWGGLLGFALAAYLAFGAGAPIDVIGLRALGGGVAGYLLAWGFAVTIWRHLLVAELRLKAEALGLAPDGSAGEDGGGAAAGAQAR